MTFSLYSKAVEELSALDSKINHLKEQLDALPKGELYYGLKDKYISWYTNDHKYIRKSDHSLAEALALSKYLTAQLNFLISERNALSDYVQRGDSALSNDPDAFRTDRNFSNLLRNNISSLSEELRTWMNADYTHSTSHPEKLKIPTSSGHIVRSKAEAMICSVLHARGIPFRYEEIIYLGKEPFAPDIIARNIRTGDFCYWEHLGLLDSFSYRHDNFEKLETYSRHGIYPNINLIITSETQDHPLNEPFINKLVDLFLT